MISWHKVKVKRWVNVSSGHCLENDTHNERANHYSRQ